MAKKELVSIGDCTIDTFIRLHDASIHCNLKTGTCEICMSFADKIPYEELTVVPAVGNAANVAVGISRMGLKARYMSGVGGDQFGKDILAALRKEKVDTKLVKVERNKQTNNHFVLSFKGERTILIKHEKYNYYDVKKIGNPEWMFFSSISEGTLPLHNKLARYVSKRPNLKMGFNPGTFQMKMGRKKIAGIYKNTYVLFVNRQEAQRVLGVKNNNVKYLVPRLHKLGPKIVCITDGPDGAYASDNEVVYYMPIYPDPAPPVERTGAGDAFSSGFMSGLMMGMNLPEALRWAPINSMNVVQHIGAQKGLYTRARAKQLLKKAPRNYKPKKIS